jgi:hypothetical protein
MRKWMSLSDLAAPAYVSWVDALWSDGTVWFEIDDAVGGSAVVCIDDREGSPTRYRLFEQANHPGKPEAVLIELGSVAEGIVVPLLSSWLDSDEARQRVRPEFIERMVGYLLRYGEPRGEGT